LPEDQELYLIALTEEDLPLLELLTRYSEINGDRISHPSLVEINDGLRQQMDEEGIPLLCPHCLNGQTCLFNDNH
jgi:hypothetical protein